MNRIVIIGAGYGGITAALTLGKQIRKCDNASITLIDKRSYHLFAPNLYEIATAEEELTTQNQLKKSITVPLAELCKRKHITFLQSEVSAIDQTKKCIQAGGKKVEYDYAVVALGSVSDFFGIEGAEKYSLPLKTFGDAVKIRNAVEFSIQAHAGDVRKQNIRIVVAGGGYTGVEFAAELSHELEFIAWKNGYPPEKIEVCIVEATNALIPGFSERVSQDVLWYLKNRGVRVVVSSPIQSIDEHYVHFAEGETLAYDIVVWTAGVKASPMPFIHPMNMDKKGRIITNHYLQSDQHDTIFAVGDSACIINTDGKAAPPTAEDAIEQGLYVGSILPLILNNKRPQPYAGNPHGSIIALGGRNAVINYAGLYFKGWIAYVVRVLVYFRYFVSVVGIWKALNYTYVDWKVYGRND